MELCHCPHSDTQMCEVEWRLGWEVAIFFEVIDDQDVPEDIAVVSRLFIDEFGSVDELFGADAGALGAIGGPLLDSVDQVVHEQRENQLLVA